ncbi:MAG: amidohydrolase family protein [Chloroflexi bacterium]|nr:amidohydrolase family protein [Chloroflexota bacterium]
MIVDCHMHSWLYPGHANKPAMLAAMPNRRKNWTEEKYKQVWDNPIEGYLEESKGLVSKSILMGLCAWNTMGINIPNEYMAGLAKQHPDKLTWCCCVDPTEKGAAQEVEKCVKQMGAVGVGELGPAYGGYFINDERCFPVFEKAQELGVPIVVHAGPVQIRTSRVAHGNVLLIDDVALDFPALKIVICHLGYHKYEDAALLIQKHENVFADISWLDTLSGLDRSFIPRYLPAVEYPYYNMLHPLLYCLSQTFGDTDKLIWGSDWKGASIKRSLAVITGINEILDAHNLPQIPRTTIDKILHENWKKVFNLGQTA